MSENNGKLTREKESRAIEIAELVSRLPEKEQEKIYYLVKCAELFSVHGNVGATHAAAL